MKKSIIVGIIVTVVIGLIATVPVFAGRPGGVRAVWESDIVPTHQATLYGLEFGKGEVYIRSNLDFKVEMEGLDDAPDGTELDVIFRHGVGMGEQEFSLGVLTINDGYGLLEGNLGTLGFYSMDNIVRVPMVRIYYEDGKALFANGFELPVT
jgi:hypothetical protein